MASHRYDADILRFLRRFVGDRNRFPTIREIVKGVGVSHQTVQDGLYRLEAEGWVENTEPGQYQGRTLKGEMPADRLKRLRTYAAALRQENQMRIYGTLESIENCYQHRVAAEEALLPGDLDP